MLTLDSPAKIRKSTSQINDTSNLNRSEYESPTFTPLRCKNGDLQLLSGNAGNPSNDKKAKAMKSQFLEGSQRLTQMENMANILLNEHNDP